MTDNLIFMALHFIISKCLYLPCLRTPLWMNNLSSSSLRQLTPCNVCPFIITISHSANASLYQTQQSYAVQVAKQPDAEIILPSIRWRPHRSSRSKFIRRIPSQQTLFGIYFSPDSCQNIFTYRSPGSAWLGRHYSNHHPYVLPYCHLQLFDPSCRCRSISKRASSAPLTKAQPSVPLVGYQKKNMNHHVPFRFLPFLRLQLGPSASSFKCGICYSARRSSPLLQWVLRVCKSDV